MSTVIKLPKDLESRLEQISKSEKKSTAAIIEESLDYYLSRKLSSKTPFELGKGLFGRYGSGRGDLSLNAESILHKKINDKEHY